MSNYVFSDGDISPEVEVAIKACWEPIIGDEFEVVVSVPTVKIGAS